LGIPKTVYWYQLVSIYFVPLAKLKQPLIQFDFYAMNTIIHYFFNKEYSFLPL